MYRKLGKHQLYTYQNPDKTPINELELNSDCGAWQCALGEFP